MHPLKQNDRKALNSRCHEGESVLKLADRAKLGLSSLGYSKLSNFSASFFQSTTQGFTVVSFAGVHIIKAFFCFLGGVLFFCCFKTYSKSCLVLFEYLS